MSIAAYIPARLHSTRLSKKLIQPLGSSTVVGMAYSNAVKMQLFSEIVCVCDSPLIADCISDVQGKAVLSTKNFETGTDRIAEYACNSEADIIVNLQGDEPFLEKQMVQQLITAFEDDSVDIATACVAISAQEAANENIVKVVRSALGNAMYFSRSPIPYARDAAQAYYYRHIGIYAFRKSALQKFITTPQPSIELAESLENLRMLHSGLTVRVIEVDNAAVGIDTQVDLENARLYFQTTIN